MPVRIYTVADGLARDEVHSIRRDSRVYLGTADGLPGRSVQDVLETRNGEYWIATVAPPKAREQQLSPREFQILRLLADGHSYKTCADQLSLSLDTVRFHIRNIYSQIHVHCKSEAVLKGIRSGLIS